MNGSSVTPNIYSAIIKPLTKRLYWNIYLSILTAGTESKAKTISDNSTHIKQRNNGVAAVINTLFSLMVVKNLLPSNWSVVRKYFLANLTIELFVRS